MKHFQSSPFKGERGGLLILALCTLIGCRSIPQAEAITQRESDSTYREAVRYDSIYIYRDRYVDRGRDTVYVKETNVEYRYRLLHDTVRVIERDSVPYPVTVVETREVRYTPWYMKALACIGVLSLVVVAYRIREVDR